MSFIEKCTRVSWIYLIKPKSNVIHVIPQFYIPVQVFHSGNSREFVNQSSADFFKQHDVLHQTTCVHTPQQNGVVEHKNQHLLKVAQVLCFTMKVPKYFWTDAIITVIYLINQMFARIIDYQTPLRVLSCFHNIPSALYICL